MGRDYTGDIEGRFRCAVQDSLDGANFGGHYYLNQEFKSCGCSIEEEDVKEDIYCEGCFEDFEGHFQQALEEGEVNEKTDSLIRCSGYATMWFEPDQLDEVREHIKKMEEQVGKWIGKYKILNEDGYAVEFDDDDETVVADYNLMTKDDNEVFARWELAKQVEACLVDKEFCQFICEL